MAPLVDVHTHIYPPSYISLLSNRTSTPYIHQPTSPSPLRLIILPSDDDPAIPPSSRGRPIDESYSSIAKKLSFMRQHSINTSVISLANPWLDFLPSSTAVSAAITVNNELESICLRSPPGTLYFFGTLPLSAPIDDIISAISHLAKLPHLKGLILGTTGLGAGLDDPALDPIWHAVEKASLLLFIHPHYGLPAQVFGPHAQNSGHVLPLSLGFPMETTIAFTRMYLSGVFVRYPSLKVLLAHAGGTIPFLAGRIESCVLHERAFRDNEGRLIEGKGEGGSIWDILKKNVWLDGVVYNAIGVKAAVEAVGEGRVLFGTDHPFFPPLDGEEKAEGEEEWASVKMNVEAMKRAFGNNIKGMEGVLGGNAIELLGLKEGKGG